MASAQMLISSGQFLPNSLRIGINVDDGLFRLEAPRHGIEEMQTRSHRQNSVTLGDDPVARPVTVVVGADVVGVVLRKSRPCLQR